MTRTSIILEDLWFQYPSTKHFLLSAFNWKREKPGKVGILGINGCGKTTLLKIISGILKPTRGFVKINDRLVKGISYTQKIVAYVPENAKLFLIGPTPYRDLLRILKDPKIVDTLFYQYGFDKMARKKLYHLSEGQRRLMAFFIAFQLPSKIILFDEPTIGLDSKGRSIFFELLNQACHLNKIILISSNDPRIFSQMDEIVVIKEGTIGLHGPPREVLFRLEQETNIIPNQIVRLMCSLKSDLGQKIPNCLTSEDLNHWLKTRRV